MYNILYVTKVNEKPYPRILLRTTCEESAYEIVKWLNKNPGRHFNGNLIDENATAYAVCITTEKMVSYTEESEDFIKSKGDSFEQKIKTTIK